MACMDDIKWNLSTAPPRLLQGVETLLGWVNGTCWDLFSHRFDGVYAFNFGERGTPSSLEAAAEWLQALRHEHGLYPYCAGDRPAEYFFGQIRAVGRYKETGYVVDEYVVDLLAGDVYEEILHLAQTFGGRVLEPRREGEAIRDVLLRMKAWCLRTQTTLGANVNDVMGQEAHATPNNERMLGEAKALAVLAQHPDWTDKSIAEAAGLHPKSLCRYDLYRQARKISKEAGKAGLSRGHKTQDGTIEAYTEG